MLDNFRSISLDTVFLGNTLKDYLIAFLVLAVASVILYIAYKFIKYFFNKLSRQAKSPVAKAILQADNRLAPIFLYIPVYIFFNYLDVHPTIKSFVLGAGTIVITVSVIRYILGIIHLLLSLYSSQHETDATMMQAIKLFASVILYLFGLIFVLSNLGFNINTLIAGLGIGGMAVALASQTILGDLFNYFSILFDKPFKVGDPVTVAGVSGTVSKIGLKGTRLTASDGELLVISNTDMTKNVLRNYDKDVMQTRRVVIQLAAQYDTTYEKMAQLPGRIKQIFSTVKDVTFARAHFKEFGASSMNFEVVYNVQSADYDLYMDRQQEINFKIMQLFDELGVVFALPAQNIYLAKLNQDS